MKRIYLLILVLGIISCNSDDEIRIDNSDLIGIWNWTNTDGGIGFQLHETPETTAKIVHLNLSGNYEYSVTENGIQISSGFYKLMMKKSIYSGKMERYIQFPENQQALEIVPSGIIKTYKNNKLEISDNTQDGIKSVFIKIE